MLRAAFYLCLLASVSPIIQSHAGEPARQPPPAEALKQEVRRISVNSTLHEALDQYRKLSGVRIEVDWPALKAVGIEPRRRIVLKASGATVEQLLELTLIQAAGEGPSLAWYIDQDVVRVTTRRRLLRRSRLATAARPTTRPAARPVSLYKLDFDNTPLGDVIVFFRDVTGANFHVNWGALKQVNLDRDTPITLKVSGISVGRALDLIFNQLNANRGKYDSIYWLIDGGVVQISTGSAFDGRLRTRIYEVADLLMIVPDFKGPRLGLDSGSSGEGGTGSDSDGLFGEEDETADAESPAEQKKHIREKLINIIKNTIGEEMWQPLGKGSINILRGKLIISQTALGFKLMEQSLRR